MATTQHAVVKEIPGNAPDVMRDYDLATLGYVETEFSIEGMATSYEQQGDRGSDGRWDVVPSTEALFEPGSWCDAPSRQTGSAARSSWSGTTCQQASTPPQSGGSFIAT